MNDAVATDEIRVNDRHRREAGDIGALAESIAARGLLHPIVVTAGGDLVCGYRRLLAVRQLGWPRVAVRRIDPDDMLLAERDENEVRKDFTPSERVAIARAIEERIGKRQGQRPDEPISEGELPQNFAEVAPGRETRDVAARKAGFGNRETYRQAAKVVDEGTPELVEAMDRGVVSPSAAATVADLPRAEQAATVAAGPKAVKAKAAAIRKGKSKVNGTVQDDPPDVAKARAAGKIAPDVVVEVTEPGPVPEPAAAPPVIVPASEDEWLAALPLHAMLSGALLSTFDADALIYLRLEAARGTFRHHATRVMNASRRKGEYAYRVSRFLKLDHPKHWLICPAVEDGGCGGTGQVPLIGQCPKCRGRGYWFK